MRIALPPNSAPLYRRKAELRVNACTSLAPVEVVVDQLRRGVRNPRHRRQVGEGRPAHRLGRAEVLKQRPLSRRPDPVDLIEWIADDILLAPRPMRPDREPVRLVAQPLDIVEDWITMRQHKGILPLHEELL